MDIINDIKDVLFATRSDAEDAFDSMKDIAKSHGNVTLADLDDLAGLYRKFEHNNAYWTAPMLNHGHISRVRDGYVLELPAPIIRGSKGKVTYRSYSPKIEPKPVWITVNTEEIDGNITDILSDVFKQVATVPGREFHITIT